MSILSDLVRVARNRARYKELSANPQLKAKSKYFGGASIVQSVCTMALAVAIMFCIKLAGNENPVVFIMGLLFGIGFGIGALCTFVGSLVNMTRQLKMNNGAIGKIAVVLFILSIVCVIVVAIFTLKQ